MAATLTALVRSRGGIKSKITRFATFLSKIERNNCEIEHIIARLEKVEALWNEFDEIQGRIEDVDDSEEQLAERVECEEAYFNVIGKAKFAIRVMTTEQAVDHDLQFRNSNHTTCNGSIQGRDQEVNNITDNEEDDSASIRANATGVKLPTMSLPVFDGNYEKWLEFYDSFQAIVEKNNKLSDIQKLYYLRLSVKGTAAEVIQSLDTSAESYRVAWDLLK